ncbi:MAG TPA: SPW repeat protein, partial [Candidatus Limnocylindrales bacterium]
WLAVSPWLAGYAGNAPATANAAFVGLGLALVSHFDASFDDVTGEWLNLAAGLWLVAAPFVLGFMGPTAAAANSLAVGFVVTGLAANALQLDKEIGRLFG